MIYILKFNEENRTRIVPLWSRILRIDRRMSEWRSVNLRLS